MKRWRDVNRCLAPVFAPALLPVLALWVLPLPTAAADPAPPLTLLEVLRAVDATHPKLLAARQKLSGAEAKAGGARGAWDPKLKAKGSLSGGPYDYSSVSAEVTQATPLWGASLFAGYRVGGGEVPSYKYDLKTLSSGEVSAGLELPLLRERDTDEARAGIQRADQERDAARCDVEAERLSVHLKASEAYWDWAAKGADVVIQERLLRAAEERAGALRERVAEGSLPPITELDNERLILERKGKLVGARRDLAEAALKLSLFLRDDDLTPVPPPPARAPAELPPPGALALPDEALDAARAREGRPDLCALRRRLRATQTQLTLAEARRAPQLNARAFVAKDLGGGAPSLAPAEVGAALLLEVPVGLRKARGDVDAAQAQVLAERALLRGEEDRALAEVQTARVDLLADLEQEGLARAQVRVAAALVEAERVKLDEGASDLVILNLREQALADAERALVKARLEFHKAEAAYDVARGLTRTPAPAR
ncbi:MAG: TolC family protein [Deltaproteobacteria bacterium]|nr:TolC family protein [Deltaproteobacteria bacterium]